jgi:hypothetical protein
MPKKATSGSIKPGERRNPKGRGKGVPNKVTADLKQLVLNTMAKLEAQGKGLDTEAEHNPKWFYENFVRPMLPKDVKLDSTGEITVIIQQFGKAKNGSAAKD